MNESVYGRLRITESVHNAPTHAAAYEVFNQTITITRGDLPSRCVSYEDDNGNDGFICWGVNATAVFTAEEPDRTKYEGE